MRDISLQHGSSLSWFFWQGLAETLFERLQALHGGAASEMLTVQYRMHAAIMAWASRALYGSRLTAADAVAGHTLADLQARALA